jgi:hypothetical protein
MDASHGLAVADAGVAAGVVGGIVDVDEGEAVRVTIAALQEAHLPQAEGTAPVVEDRESRIPAHRRLVSHGVMLWRTVLPMR